MKVWAWSRPGVTNFGDELGPAILRRLNIPVRRVAFPHEADIITAGSIMTHASGFSGIVWGTGTLKSTDRSDLSKADVRAVRGPKTRDLLELPTNITLGDPGILVSKLWPKAKTKYKLGWVPHYKDPRTLETPDVTINLLDPVDVVISKISSCREIVTSSLHGLIVAQSFGIPAVHLPYGKVIGGSWKFDDHRLALFRDELPSVQNNLLNSIEDLL